MPKLYEIPAICRRVLNVFFVLDTSSRMAGAPIIALNMAMSEMIDVLNKAAKENADAIIKVAVLQFSTGCEWLNSNGPEEPGDFIWSDLEADGLGNLGAALTELDKKLSRSEYLSSITGNYLPMIIFMTDGFATDDYSKALGKVRQNKWFQHATKIGFAIGENPDVNMISELVGNSEAVFRTDDLKILQKLLCGLFIQFRRETTYNLSRTTYYDEEV